MIYHSFYLPLTNKSNIAMYTRFLVLCLLFSTFCKSQEIVKFTLFADIHQDIIPDASVRLNDILDATQKNSSQFIVQLGDFAMQKPANKYFFDLWLNYPLEKYSVLGNHDMDIGTKEQYVKYMKMEAPYYYFDKGILRFIVLDTNYYLDTDGRMKDYADSNYYGKETDHISSEQLDWLELLLKDKHKQVVVFTHAPVDGVFEDNASFIKLRNILESAKKEGLSIAGVMSGHNNLDCHTVRNGIHYIQINSASYLWIGEKYADRSRYPESIYKDRPSLPSTAPYKKALYANIAINPIIRQISIKGAKSNFISPSPHELGKPENINSINQEVVKNSAVITDISYKY